VNRKDFMLMAHLRRNARESLTKMSRLTNIPVSTLYDKLKQHEDKIIQKHTSIVDFARMGFTTKANILLKVDYEARDGLREFLAKEFNVNSVYKINSGFDYMVEGIFRHIKDMEDFIERIEEKFAIRDKKVYYVIEDVVKEAFMADPQTVGLVVA
jgi:DNA-binding Lrp family transcriptional regulator